MLKKKICTSINKKKKETEKETARETERQRKREKLTENKEKKSYTVLPKDHLGLDSTFVTIIIKLRTPSLPYALEFSSKEIEETVTDHYMYPYTCTSA